MSQSLSKIYIHLVFHVKSTSPRISEEDTQHLHAYIGTAINKLGCSTIIMGGTGDHVHALFVLSREVTISQVVKEIKRSSSMYLKKLNSSYNHFAWQNGYAVFSIGQSGVDNATKYISNQAAHHAKVNFEDEYRLLLEKYNIEYNRDYVLQD